MKQNDTILGPFECTSNSVLNRSPLKLTGQMMVISSKRTAIMKIRRRHIEGRRLRYWHHWDLHSLDERGEMLVWRIGASRSAMKVTVLLGPWRVIWHPLRFSRVSLLL